MFNCYFILYQTFWISYNLIKSFVIYWKSLRPRVMFQLISGSHEGCVNGWLKRVLIWLRWASDLLRPPRKEMDVETATVDSNNIYLVPDINHINLFKYYFRISLVPFFINYNSLKYFFSKCALFTIYLMPIHVYIISKFILFRIRQH